MFANEDEAFAAAEETYRAYVDALNQVDLSDPETFEAVYAWTTGELNASDRKGLSEYHADRVSVSGESQVAAVELKAFNTTNESVQLAVCLDISTVEVVASNGDSLVDPDRTKVQSLIVSLDPDPASPTEMLITSIGPREGVPTCIQ